MQTPQEVVARYIQDAEAAERNFEDTLMTFASTGEQNAVKSMFEAASRKAKTQHERLEARLRELGSSPSKAKSFLAHVLAMSPTMAQIGHEGAEKNTQHLIACIGAASAEMAMYEALATVAAAAGDTVTESLARELQKEEKDDWDESWKLLPSSAVAAFQTVMARSAGA
jgi:ferritin-like metal-binding protein YciE